LKTLLNAAQVQLVLQRLVHQLLEHNPNLNNTVLIGLQPRGVFFADRIIDLLKNNFKLANILYGKLDFTFYRDDVHSNDEIILPNDMDMPHSLEGKKVILIDDVLYTGRSIRSALDALVDFGRPASVALMVLVDRRFSRELPIQPDYVGISIDSINSQKVSVNWQHLQHKDEVLLIDKEN
jgi:pyrimidine operon attenuation protein / uracil phosphoribosyltransferase